VALKVLPLRPPLRLSLSKKETLTYPKKLRTTTNSATLLSR
jgi:hypothetical protein